MNLCNIEYSLEKIKNIYETLNISKSIFIVNESMYNSLYEKLVNEDYPVCLLKEFTKFKNHIYRILLIKDIEIPEIYKNNISDHLKIDTINLILFINTPEITNLTTCKLFFNISNLNDINIFEL
jgi:hypothetical protein|tara:strand:- start:451 stop:822 length:372 start_codon:yes stop_codon:yes gene_type:complete